MMINGTLMQLFYLGIASNVIYPFTENGNSSFKNMRSMKPTLSPKDPNFQVWWQEHKSEWQNQEKNGQEPADN